MPALLINDELYGNTPTKDDIDWVQLSEEVPCYYRRKNGIVEINIAMYGVNITSNVTLGTLPDNCLPNFSIRQHNYTGNIMLDISRSGAVVLMLYDGATSFSGNIFIDKTYIPQ